MRFAVSRNTLFHVSFAGLTLLSAGCNTADTSGTGGSVATGGGGSGASGGTGGTGGTGGVPVVGEVPFTSGSRLRANVLDAGGGARNFAGWHDTELGVDCGFRLAEDGVIRCLPGGSTSYHTDASCTSYVVPNPSCSPAPKYVMVDLPEQVDCHQPTAVVHEVGSKIAVPTLFLGSGCQDVGPPPVDQDVYLVGDAVPPSAFVAAVEKSAPRGDQLEVPFLEAEDGAMEVTGVRDTKRDAACGEFPFGAEQRCVPWSWASNGFFYTAIFSDASCTNSLVAAGTPAPSCPEAQIVVNSTGSNQCDASYLLFEVGAKVTPSLVYYSDVNGCGPGGPPIPDVTYYELGPPAPASAFPLLQMAHVGTGRLTSVQETAGDGSFLFPASRFFDADLAVDCYPEVFSDGKLRCMPSITGYLGEPLFADAACTKEVAFVNPCGAAPHFAYRSGGEACSLAIAEVYGVGDSLPAGGSHYALVGGSCQEQPAFPDVTVRLLGEKVPFDTFVEVSRVTD